MQVMVNEPPNCWGSMANRLISFLTSSAEYAPGNCVMSPISLAAEISAGLLAQACLLERRASTTGGDAFPPEPFDEPPEGFGGAAEPLLPADELRCRLLTSGLIVEAAPPPGKD